MCVITAPMFAILNMQSLTKDQLKPAADQFAAKAEPTARDIKEKVIQPAAKAVSNPIDFLSYEFAVQVSSNLQPRR